MKKAYCVLRHRTMKTLVLVVLCLVVFGLRPALAATDLEYLEGSVVMLKCPHVVTTNIGGADYEVLLKKPGSEEAIAQVDRVPAGTGFLVKSDDCVYIITAGHIAAEM